MAALYGYALIVGRGDSVTEKFNLTMPAGCHLWSAPFDEEMLANARKWIAEHNFTEDDVKIVRDKDNFLSVVAKRDVNL